MAEELSYILITPYTILKSRTGGVIARLLSRADIELVSAQMIAPSRDLAEEYAKGLKETVSERDPKMGELFHDYVLSSFSPTDGRRHRVMMLLFKGENACEKLFKIAGDIQRDPNADVDAITGETIRDTYADLVMDSATGKPRYFEPAVLTPPTHKCAVRRLKMFADFAENEPNLVENVKYENPDAIERTLVIIKPENWRYPSSKPGNIIDMFSRTGLRIIGCKVHRMSVAQALEFYGPVQDALRSKLAPKIGEKAKEILENELDFEMPDAIVQPLVDSVGVSFADDQFGRIIEFMSGRKPEECPEEELNAPGLVKCMPMVYEGVNAVKKIRDVLGPTDPTKAPSGTIRREFGSDVMVNTAHASDSPDNAKREMGILKIQENNLASVIKEYLASIGG